MTRTLSHIGIETIVCLERMKQQQDGKDYTLVVAREFKYNHFYWEEMQMQAYYLIPEKERRIVDVYVEGPRPPDEELSSLTERIRKKAGQRY
ncbi:hypothetical protein HYV81_03140 [Candidatus Woesearchaeota archaeon]|nr:hypothetical protein [Candidatus Woesearchaeota archaeon]